MKCIETYNKRTWLNKESSPSTGNVICFDGCTTWHGEKMRNTFLQISDCSYSLNKRKSKSRAGSTPYASKRKKKRKK